MSNSSVINSRGFEPEQPVAEVLIVVSKYLELFLMCDRSAAQPFYAHHDEDLKAATLMFIFTNLFSAHRGLLSEERILPLTRWLNHSRFIFSIAIDIGKAASERPHQFVVRTFSATELQDLESLGARRRPQLPQTVYRGDVPWDGEGEAVKTAPLRKKKTSKKLKKKGKGNTVVEAYNPDSLDTPVMVHRHVSIFILYYMYEPIVMYIFFLSIDNELFE